jgi:NAD(P)-dependent dehydrogenase (short-subunit alcohol dehydrogenase family)
MTNQSILITGANRGIGACLAKHYLARGDQVIAGRVVSPFPKSLLAVRNVSEPGLSGKGFSRILPLDMESDSSIASLVAALSGTPIDVLLLNAGILLRDSLESTDLSKNLALSFRVNATAPLLLAQALKANVMLGASKKIVFMTSRMGSVADSMLLALPIHSTNSTH